MNLTPSKFKFPHSQKLINFGKYFLISLVLLLGLHLAADANNPEVIIQPEWTANLEASTKLIAADQNLFVIRYEKDGEDYVSELVALDIASGKVQWKQKLPSYKELVRRRVFLDNGIVYVSHDQGVMGFDPKTGSVKASFKYEEIEETFRDRTIGIHQDIAVYGDSKSLRDHPYNNTYRIEVFGIKQDQTIWSYKPNADGMIGIYVGPHSIEPVVQDGILFLPTVIRKPAGRTEKFTAIDVASGKVLWTKESLQNPDGLWSAKVFGDTIYTSVFGNSDMKPSGKLRAIALQTGKEKWSYVITGKVKAVSDREVYVWQSKGNSGSNFVVLDKETGRFLRRFSLPRVYDDEPPDLVLSDGLIYVADMEIKNVTYGFYGSADNNSWVSAFDTQTGKLVWRTPTLMNSHIYQLPVINRADESKQKRLIFASNFLGKEGSSKVQSFVIP
ncbi:PQQ-binding-like beta-propeller repeat protein [Pseudanabaena sp. ABRG5-3]|uniref:outer membrane protein assembly factor BamB family protein n=1 Tax=Pseudanabaena sp. ABRG5-3 TaxID=685565 RepID=UPI000DC6E9AC|nr:PQQ-binding-like beta-propeller repeat protein [Pseudanabaena sp. ABRG5-3]BBC22669.1 pyrrolo-quinoline quinone [Pseudanabaena sp. ABRG5-3]